MQEHCILNPLATGSAFEYDLSDGVFGGVRDGDVRRGGPGPFVKLTRMAVKEESRCAGAL